MTTVEFAIWFDNIVVEALLEEHRGKENFPAQEIRDSKLEIMRTSLCEDGMLNQDMVLEGIHDMLGYLEEDEEIENRETVYVKLKQTLTKEV